MQKILSGLRKACEEFKLIQDGDKIAVGISGGKDSLTLLAALATYKKYFNKDFSLIAISVDLNGGEFGETDYTEIKKFCKSYDVELSIIPSNIFSVVFNIRKEKNPCSLCANMRRGTLNSAAKNLGCNKVALGHHKDDLIETFLMSLFFEGRLSTFKPISYLSNTDLYAIRPLIYCDEKDIINVSKDFPILKNVCPANKNTERENAKKILSNFDQKYPGCKEKIFNAIIHKERYNLFDKM